MQLKINSDSFSSGQMASKLWLCRELEKLNFSAPQTIWLLGGWYGMLSLLLYSREKLPIKNVVSFDIDGQAVENSLYLNDYWKWKSNCFSSVLIDANRLDYHATDFGPTPDIVINTSAEHFLSDLWFENIPTGKMVILQGNDLAHKNEQTHVWPSVEKFTQHYPLSKIFYRGQLKLEYSENSYTRFMLIGRR